MKITINTLLLTFLFITSSVSTAVVMKTWCVAKPSASTEELQNNINYACQVMKQTNCTKMITKGGACFLPDTLNNHASVVMHRYYAENGRHGWNCDFKGTGLVTITDPSYSLCKYI